ncbi:endosome-associated-trafficking regulator 1 isoform X2 [Falco rusticolus]|uniref:endosome-associated-trafficking regulator 1 isoform X2 n=1 Tax=Falco rusticolus TaxID=120794 RepID=UPI0018869814|nr:endosome-associated-trafficking regulator 1 isoform X2 [Falco rusticolus]
MAAGGLPAAGPAEPNPFSFREFVRSKARSGETAGGARQAVRPGPSLGPLLFPDLAPPGEAEDDEEEWDGSYQPSAVEQAHLAATGPASASAGSFCEGAGLAGSEEPNGASLGAPPGPCCHSPRQPSYAELKEENASLRSKINKLQIFSESQADKMRKLEKKLEENKIKEEKEAQDLEAMVQHVEQNLQLMTVQLKNYKMENEALRLGQSASLAVVKQNADVALQNLLTVITNSRSSIKQLVSGAESLQLVADLLKSIDRISEVSEDGQ